MICWTWSCWRSCDPGMTNKGPWSAFGSCAPVLTWLRRETIHYKLILVWIFCEEKQHIWRTSPTSDHNVLGPTCVVQTPIYPQHNSAMTFQGHLCNDLDLWPLLSPIKSPLDLHDLYLISTCIHCIFQRDQTYNTHSVPTLLSLWHVKSSISALNIIVVPTRNLVYTAGST